MYIRFTARYFNEVASKEEFGVFQSADYVRDFVEMDKMHHSKLAELIKWFDKNVPIPDYYQDKRNRQESKAATSWFKDSQKVCLSKMNEMVSILAEYGVIIERVGAKKMVGEKIYEDEFQIVVIPYRDIKKLVR